MPQAVVKRLIKRGLLAAGYYSRELARSVFPGAVVLCYHGIRGDGATDTAPFQDLHVRERVFEAHCRLIRDHCHPIDLDALGDIRAGGARPARPVLVTLDDGYRNVLERALPILRRYEIPAVAFVCSEPIAERRLLWFDRVARAEGEAAVERLKTLAYAAWRERTSTCETCDESDPQAVLTIDEVRTLARTPGIEIGCHSRTHPILARATREEQSGEVLASKHAIEHWIGARVRAFAYPNGRPGIDYTQTTVSALRECGYTDAFSICDRFVSPDDDPLEQPRFTMLDSISAAELAHRLCHAWPR